MFSSEELEAIPEGIRKIFSNLEQSILDDIVRRIGQAGQITRTADYQINRLYQIGELKSDTKKYIQKTLKLSNAEIDKIYHNVTETGYSRDAELYKDAGKEYISFSENKPLQQLINAVEAQTDQEMANITRTLAIIDSQSKAYSIDGYFQKVMDRAEMQLTSGAFDMNTVLKLASAELAKSGVRTVRYESDTGRTTYNKIDVAARRAILTGMNQITGKITDDNAEALGTNYFEVSAHPTARPSHMVWQGGIYTREQLVSVCGLGDVQGLLGANCYHHYDPFIPGVSVRNYTDKQLADWRKKAAEKTEYNGKKYTPYEATQRQRRLETIMRSQRQLIHLMKTGEVSGKEITAENIKYVSTMSEYIKFSKAMKLPTQYERIYQDGLRSL